MEARYFMCFVNATVDLFQTMLAMKATVGQPKLKTGRDDMGYNVFGMIGLSGNVTGSMILKLPSQTGVELVESFLGERLEPGSPDFADAIGELSNMIGGGAKSKLGLPNVSITTPTVVVGAGIWLARPTGSVSIEIPHQCDKGPFALEVTLKK